MSPTLRLAALSFLAGVLVGLAPSAYQCARQQAGQAQAPPGMTLAKLRPLLVFRDRGPEEAGAVNDLLAEVPGWRRLDLVARRRLSGKLTVEAVTALIDRLGGDATLDEAAAALD